MKMIEKKFKAIQVKNIHLYMESKLLYDATRRSILNHVIKGMLESSLSLSPASSTAVVVVAAAVWSPTTWSPPLPLPATRRSSFCWPSLLACESDWFSVSIIRKAKALSLPYSTCVLAIKKKLSNRRVEKSLLIGVQQILHSQVLVCLQHDNKFITKLKIS